MAMSWTMKSPENLHPYKKHMSQGRSTPCIGDGHPTFTLIRNPYNGYINPYYWVDDHPLLYGNNGILDPSTYIQEGPP